LQNQIAITAVGPITAAALRQAGIENTLIPSDTTTDAVIAALETHFAAVRKASLTGVHQK
jgi:uroporphyrinogen-III synthase